MKNIFLSLVLLLAISISLFSQSNDEQSVRQTLEAYQTAIKNNDSSAASKLLTENFLMTPASGVQRLNKLQRLESIKSGQFKYSAFKHEDVKVRISGEAAYVIVKANVTFKISEKDYTVESVNLFFAKTNGDWLLADECYLGRNCYR